jgi:hypothetical protein
MGRIKVFIHTLIAIVKHVCNHGAGTHSLNGSVPLQIKTRQHFAIHQAGHVITEPVLEQKENVHCSKVVYYFIHPLNYNQEQELWIQTFVCMKKFLIMVNPCVEWKYNDEFNTESLKGSL